MRVPVRVPAERAAQAGTERRRTCPRCLPPVLAPGHACWPDLACAAG